MKKVINPLTIFIFILSITLIGYSLISIYKDKYLETQNTYYTNKSPQINVDRGTTTAHINGYDIILSTQTEDDIRTETKLQIFKKEKLEFETIDQNLIIFQREYERNDKDLINLDTAEKLVKYSVRDVTGDKIPELSIIGFSGGAHCCYSSHIIELGNTAKILWSLNTMDSPASFTDINKDGVMEIEILDSIFRYWHSGYVLSPFPYIIWKYDNKAKMYIVNKEAMRKPGPSKRDIEKEAQIWAINGWDTYNINNTDNRLPWSYAVYLIYNGNIREAREYIDLAWRENREFLSKKDFLQKFKERIKESSYYSNLSPDLIDINQL